MLLVLATLGWLIIGVLNVLGLGWWTKTKWDDLQWGQQHDLKLFFALGPLFPAILLFIGICWLLVVKPGEFVGRAFIRLYDKVATEKGKDR